MIKYKTVCTKCGEVVEWENSIFGAMAEIKRNVWSNSDFKDLSDELKKDFAISLFIQLCKDQTTDKIQGYKKTNIRAMNER